MKIARIDGVLVEPLGPVWVVFSPANGETTLLNDESAAILEVLSSGALDTTAVVTQLAEDAGMSDSDLTAALDSHWARLIGCGLLRQVSAPGPCAG